MRGLFTRRYGTLEFAVRFQMGPVVGRDSFEFFKADFKWDPWSAVIFKLWERFSSFGHEHFNILSGCMNDFTLAGHIQIWGILTVLDWFKIS